MFWRYDWKRNEWMEPAHLEKNKKQNGAASNRLKAKAPVFRTRCDGHARMKVYRATLPPCLLIYYQTNKAVNESMLLVVNLES